MKIITKFALFAIFSAICIAQVAFPTTTLTGALTAKGSGPVSVASTANIHSYWMGTTILVVDGEAICPTLVIPVAGYVFASRGCQGTATQNHSIGATVYTGPPSYFYFLPPSGAVVGGSCTASQFPVMPYIVLNAGGGATKWNCTGGIWSVS